MREAAGRPVLQAAQVSIVVLAARRGLVAPAWRGASRRRWRRRPAARGASNTPFWRAWWLAEPLPVEVGPALGLHEGGVLGHGLGAELADEAHHAGHGGGERPAGRAPRRGTSRSRGGCRCRRAAAGGGRRRSGRRPGRLPSARSKRPLHASGRGWCGSTSAAPGRRRSSTAVSWRGRLRGRRRRRGRPARCARTRRRSTGGGRAGRPPRRPGAPPGLPHRSGVAPLQREVLPDEHADLVGGVVELRPGDVGRGRARRSRPASRGQHDVAAQLVGRGLGQGHAGGAEVGALQEEPLAVDVQRSSCACATWRKPVRTLRASLMLVVDVDRRPSTVDSGWSPSDHGHHSGGCRRRSVHSTWLLPRGQRELALPLDAVVHRRADADGAGLVAVELGRAPAPGPARRRPRGTAPACRSIRTGPRALDPHRPPEAARVPRRVERVPVLEHAGEVALLRAVVRRRARDLDGQHVLAARGGPAR